ncbi:MAG: YeeE/YedE family protein [Anaerolineales bacterium]|nr:YeeE/YedE family protein [Anaerolineales bacterium]
MTTVTVNKKKFSFKKLFDRESKPYANPYFGGILMGLVLFASLFVTGSGLGASGTAGRLAAFIVDLIAPQHVDRVPDLVHWAGGDTNPLDATLVILTLGSIIGGFTSGLIHGRTKFEINKGPNISNRTRLIVAFIGGMFFVYGARMARGCTSGQGLSGGAVLSAGSWAVVFSIFGGAWAMAYFVRKLWL